MVQKSIVFHYHDENDMGIWHDVLSTAIDEAKQGRKPLACVKSSYSSSSHKSDVTMDEERADTLKNVANDYYGFRDNIFQIDKEIRQNSDNIFVQKSRRAKGIKGL